MAVPSRVGGAALASALVLAACSGGGSHTGGAGKRAISASGASGGAAVPGALSDAHVKLTPIVALEQPTAMAVRTGDTTLFVTEQAGKVRAIRDGRLDPKPVLDLTAGISAGGERGLLGIAFASDGGHVYLDYTNLDGDTRVDEYTMRGTAADRGSRRELLAIKQPQANHNGGQLLIDANGLLYIGMGDGGAGGDVGPGHVPGGNAQSLDTLLGKILRIDPRPSGKRPYSIPPGNPFADGKKGRPEIWAYGLRNPWRFSFDTKTGDLWIADVGQNKWEEIDFVAAGTGAGENFGWNRLEATHPYAGEPPSGAVAPVFEYSHEGGACSVTGGFVYRGAKIAALTGTYLFADYCGGDVRGLLYDGHRVTAERGLGVHAEQISSFGRDNAGDLYVLSQQQGLLRIDPA
jgi:glucose/arabinose dehydrogenase